MWACTSGVLRASWVLEGGETASAAVELQAKRTLLCWLSISDLKQDKCTYSEICVYHLGSIFKAFCWQVCETVCSCIPDLLLWSFKFLYITTPLNFNQPNNYNNRKQVGTEQLYLVLLSPQWLKHIKVRGRKMCKEWCQQSLDINRTNSN